MSPSQEQSYRALGLSRPELAVDPRFRMNADRLANLKELIVLIQGWLQSMPSDEASMGRDEGTPRTTRTGSPGRDEWLDQG
jgi:crotonobetainyl-CoA:carnitine CoA-transferase CaiB-like acyl-CoA transferase